MSGGPDEPASPPAGMPSVAERMAQLRAAGRPPDGWAGAAATTGTAAAVAAADTGNAGHGGDAEGVGDEAGPGRWWRRLGGCLVLAALAALVTGPSGNADRPLAGASGSLAGERGVLFLAAGLLAWAGLTGWPRLRGLLGRPAAYLTGVAAEWAEDVRDRSGSRGRRRPSLDDAASRRSRMIAEAQPQPPPRVGPRPPGQRGESAHLVPPTDRTWAVRSNWVIWPAPPVPTEPSVPTEPPAPTSGRLAAGLAMGAAAGETGTPGRRRWYRRPWARGAGYALALGAAAGAPLVVSTTVRQVMVNDIGLYALLSLGLSIVVGRAGMLDLGCVAFCAIGAYTAAYLCAPGAMPWHAPVTVSPLVAMPAAMAAAALVGLALGAPLLRRHADLLAIVTLAFGGVVQLVANNADGITGGAGGVFGVPPPSVRIGGFHYAFGLDPLPYYYLLLGLVVLVMAALAGWDRSRAARACAALRQDEVAAGVLGVRAARMRLLAFTAGAAVAGLAGAVLATKQFFNPQTFSPQASMLVLTVVVAGGAGSRLGAVLGAVVLQGLAFLLRDHVPAADRFLYFGALVMIMTALRPRRLLPARLRLGGPSEGGP
ncbi:ABC transporter permease subunit [Pseudofrankia sp. BMG5.37]|uniref:branched-chain amino acid ABC transporter permease n=1 Tax=Pseudofrankia sp. BMG5.37 TaxID=3050035 RepID=UPI0028948035|nr:hypothetical protein [Pseudofrankia sp. BMG5.37]MDT3438292.1 hypothetical protein [Pseudofrankia sp. BMG5.37]